MQDYQFKLEFKVRDYECDIQGVVNNSVYQNYCEHARHEFLKSLGVDFAEFAQKGINLVVTRIEIDYKIPLRSGDAFIVGSNIERISPIRFGFYQDIYRLSDNKLTVKAKVIGTALNERGRPFLPEQLATLIMNDSKTP